MSSLVFPSRTPQSLGFAWPVKKTPVFATLVQPTVSGRGEVRVGLTPYPRWQFELDVSYLRGDFGQPSSYFEKLLGFYFSVQGKLDDWLFTDPYDNAISGQQFGTGDGATTAFQITRNFAGTSGIDIVQNLNGAPTIKVNGTTLTAGTDYALGSTGVVTFASAPASSAVITWDGSYYFRCRFNDDSLSLQEDLYQVWSVSGLKFISVIL
ncbi:MAG: DUF2460 domain-containing protein [Patescibacteria group bacterium]|nr:DUF2460 domain-containing protein [Patescibacteria group bacterium]